MPQTPQHKSPRVGPSGGTLRRALPQEARSLRHQVADALREAIVSGELAPGERLLENALSEQMQISRGPLREALRELEREGLAISFPYRGTVVTDISRETVVEVLMPIRVVLETCGFRHAREHLDDAVADHLNELIGKMAAAAEAADERSLVETDLAFHRYVMELSGQDEAIRLWMSIESRVRRFFYSTTPPDPSYLRTSAAQHRELVEHLRTSSDEDLVTAVRTHIQNVPGYTEPIAAKPVAGGRGKTHAATVATGRP